ncbi:cyclodeaminase/cyclohydrolase family protein [Proteocatella sphenisci]|uniref:cyclodeaminase/cyclohydrolase family protein n=1 Tax=Proteocatella sphenisci TaxID=181070 RepID=UPI0004B866E2|nr:cyclodeaminase/cyclohydrolase family protein [Proteocatella sphenisci]
MEMKNMTIEDFVSKTASSEPAPGGGSVAALAGALAGALAEMVARLTIDKKGYEDVQEEMKAMANKAEKIRIQLIDDIQRDTNSFNKYMDALGMPKETEEQKETRRNAMQAGLKAAAIVPFEVANTAYGIMELAEIAVEKGNTNAVTDGLVAAMMARTAVLSALLNTKINLGSIKDEQFVREYADKVRELEIRAVEFEGKILSKSKL